MDSGVSSFCPVCDPVWLWPYLSLCGKKKTLAITFEPLKDADFIFCMHANPFKCQPGQWPSLWTLCSVSVNTYSRNWVWSRSIFIIGSVWRWNWYSIHINLNNVILWGIIQICEIFVKPWNYLFCFGVRYSFWPFALTRECALRLLLCEKSLKTYFACGLVGFSKIERWIPELVLYYVE